MKLDQDFDFYSLEVQPPPVSMSLEEELDATYHGLVCGSKISYQTGDVVSHVSGSVAAYHVLASYNGYQESNTASRPYTARESDTENEICMGLKLEGGVTRHIKNWTFGLNAGAQYLSYVPKIIASNKGTSAGTTDGKPSHIGDDNSFGWKIGMNVGYVF